MHNALPSQDAFHQSLSIHRSLWITLPLYCPSSSFAKTCAQKPATGDTICRLWITLLASNFFHLTITTAKQTYPSSLLSSLAPRPLLVSSICSQQGGLGVKPFRAGSVIINVCQRSSMVSKLMKRIMTWLPVIPEDWIWWPKEVLWSPILLMTSALLLLLLLVLILLFTSLSRWR